MRIAFLTFPVGHLVSDIEYARLAKGLSKVNVELYRGIPEGDFDMVLVKGWSHNWQQVLEKVGDNKPIIYYSIGTEWKLNATSELNEPIRELYKNASAVVHISEYCRLSHEKIFHSDRGEVIIPACEPKLSPTLKPLGSPLKLATTCIPRPVKRLEQVEELCKIHGIDLVVARGTTDNFDYYHDCDGYIHLSRKEGMPNTVLEAMSYGLPCIVTNYGGAKEAVGDAGIVIQNDPEGPWDPDHIEPIDPILFEKALLDFRNRHTELRYRVRERVLTELNDYVTACKLKEVFESCA